MDMNRRELFIMDVEDGPGANLDHVRERIRRYVGYERIPRRDGKLALKARLITAQEAHLEFLRQKYGGTGEVPK